MLFSVFKEVEIRGLRSIYTEYTPWSTPLCACGVCACACGVYVCVPVCVLAVWKWKWRGSWGKCVVWWVQGSLDECTVHSYRDPLSALIKYSTSSRRLEALPWIMYTRGAFFWVAGQHAGIPEQPHLEVSVAPASEGHWRRDWSSDGGGFLETLAESITQAYAGLTQLRSREVQESANYKACHWLTQTPWGGANEKSMIDWYKLSFWWRRGVRVLRCLRWYIEER